MLASNAALHEETKWQRCAPRQDLNQLALDECDIDNSNTRITVYLLVETRSLGEGLLLWVFLTSRPKVLILHEFRQLADTEHKDAVLHNTFPSITNQDITTSLECNNRIFAQERYPHAD